MSASEPRTLYKYMTAQRALNCIPEVGDRAPHATQPAALNDPFECAVTPAAGGSKIRVWSKELTMTSINDIADLVQILQDHPEWRNTVRALIVGEELGNLPKALEILTQATNENFNLVHEQFGKVDQRLERLETDVAEIRTDIAELKTNVSELKTNVAQLTRDGAQTRGGHAKNEATNDAAIIAMRMGMEFVRVLTSADLIQMAKEAPNVVPSERLESFAKADLVIEGRVGDATHYNAVEISFTGQESDAERATTNARFIQQLTGCPANPMVASVRYNPSLKDRIDSGRLFWYEIPIRDLEPE